MASDDGDAKPPGGLLSKADKEELDVHIIHAVRQFPCLYDPTNKNYRDGDAGTAAWKDIAKLCEGREWTECKDRWRKLRDAFVKVKKNLGKKGHDGGRRQTSWQFYEAMSFLAEHVKHRPPRKSSDEPEDDMSPDETAEAALHPVQIDYRVGDDGQVKVLHDGNGAAGSQISSRRLVWSDESGSPSKAKRACRRMDPVEMAILDTLGGQGPKAAADAGLVEDEEGLFGKMVAATLRRFPPRAKALCKFRIQEIIFEQENDNLGSSSP